MVYITAATAKLFPTPAQPQSFICRVLLENTDQSQQKSRLIEINCTSDIVLTFVRSTVLGAIVFV